MSKEIIAVIRLSVGEVGYYDDLSCIYLTASAPQRDVYAGTNCTQLRRSVKSGRLKLLSGSLGEERKIQFGKKGNKFTGPTQTEIEPVVTPVIAPVVPEPVQEVAPAVEVEQVVEAAPAIEEAGVIDIAPVKAEVIEEVIEEVVVEEVAAEAVVETEVPKVAKKKNK